MWIRLPLIGSGVDADPYRVAFPRYRNLIEDIPNMRAIVEIDERDAPPSVDGDGTALRPNIGGRFVTIGLRPGQRLLWLARLSKRIRPGDPFVPPDPA